MGQIQHKPQSADEDDAVMERLIGYNLKRAYLIVQNDYRKAMGDDGLSPRVFAALSFVIDTPNITQSDLARRLGVERSGLVAIVDELEGRGYLERVPVPGDRRVQALSPTTTGSSAYVEAVEKVQAHEDALLKMLSEDEKNTLLELLGKIRTKSEGMKS